MLNFKMIGVFMNRFCVMLELYEFLIYASFYCLNYLNF